MSYICRDCLATVGNGEAILRSVSFQVAAYCRDCTAVVMATGRPPELPVFVPEWRKHLTAKELREAA